MKKYILLLFVIFFSITNVFASPDELYNAAWKTLDGRFYDKTMNHQDWNRWKTKYHNLSTYEDACLAVDTMIESLNDPYTVFMKPQNYKNELMEMDGRKVELGIYIRKVNGKYYITPIKNSPAEKAGIKKNDILLAIDGKSVENMSATEFTDALNIEDKKSIEFLIKRKGFENTIYNIIPTESGIVSIFDIPPYKNVNIPSNIKYLRITSFMDKNLAKKFQEIMEQYDDKFDGYIIDLRNNSGGIAKNAAVMANMLLKDKIILKIMDRDGNVKVINSNSDVLTEKPVVVLVNRNSASASEIFVAAIKDNKRGIIVGEKTYGKGIMQDVVELSDDYGMNITVKSYLTPSGEFIHNKGIQPDINIKMNKLDFFTRKDRALNQAIKLIK